MLEMVNLYSRIKSNIYKQDKSTCLMSFIKRHHIPFSAMSLKGIVLNATPKDHILYIIVCNHEPN